MLRNAAGHLATDEQLHRLLKSAESRVLVALETQLRAPTQALVDGERRALEGATPRWRWPLAITALAAVAAPMLLLVRTRQPRRRGGILG